MLLEEDKELDYKKKLDTLRKRNDELTSKLNEAQEKLVEAEFDKEMSYAKAKELIRDLTALRYEWKTALLEVQRCKAGYERLIEEVKLAQKGAEKKKWYSRILNMMGLS